MASSSAITQVLKMDIWVQAIRWLIQTFSQG
jgi:hypothetical protein